jgi:spore coat protein U-like protein
MKYSSLLKSALPAAVLGLLALGLASTSAFANNSSTGTLTVNASVVTACSITGGTLSFGTYTGPEIDQSFGFTVTCTSMGPYSIGLSAGSGKSATTSTRSMTGTAHSASLNYALFLDSAHGTNWDDIGGTHMYSGTGSGSSQTVTVYGVLASGQNLVTDSYSDTIIATISY